MNCVFLLRIDINYSSFLVKFCQYFEYSIRFFKLLPGIYSWLTVFVSIIFKCKKNIESIFLKVRNNFVWYINLLYANFHKLWYITIQRISSNIFFILCFPIRIHVKQPKIKTGIILKLVNQFRLNFAEFILNYNKDLSAIGNKNYTLRKPFETDFFQVIGNAKLRPSFVIFWVAQGTRFCTLTYFFI